MTGSGFFIRPGEVVTNLHVVEGARRVEIRTLDGKGKTYPVEGVLALDEEGDLAHLERRHARRIARAQLEIRARRCPKRARTFSSSAIRSGSKAPSRTASSRRCARCRTWARSFRSPRRSLTATAGSPLFNMKGQVVGVITIKVTNGQNINLALGASRFGATRAARSFMSFERARGAQREQAAARSASADWWYRNGLNSLWLGNYDSALDSFETAVDKNPDARRRVDSGRLLQGQAGQEQRGHKRLRARHPARAQLRRGLQQTGRRLLLRGQLTTRRSKSTSRPRACDPRMAEAYYNLGMTYLELGDRAAALAQARALKGLDAELYRKLSAEIER